MTTLVLEEPVVAMALGIVLLHERLSLLGIVGAGLVLVGLLVQGRGAASRSPAPRGCRRSVTTGGFVLRAADLKAWDLPVPIGVHAGHQQGVDVDDPASSRTFKTKASARSRPSLSGPLSPAAALSCQSGKYEP